MESSCKADEDLEFQLFNFNEVEFLNNVNDIMEGNYQHNETAANFSKDNSPDDPISTEASNMPKEPVDVGVQFQPPLTTDDQPQLDQMNADPDTIGYENVLVDQLVSSPDRTNESFLHQSSSDANLRQSIYSGFDGNASPLGHGDAHETTSPPFSPLIMEPTHSFPLALAERLTQNEDYSIQPFHSEHERNSIQTNQVNGHISPAENRGYSTQPFHSEHGVNSVQTSQVDYRIRLAEKLPQNGGYSTRPLHSEHGVNSSQTNQVNGHVRLVEKFPQNDAYSTQSFNSEHGVNLVQTNQANGGIGLAEKLQQNGSYSTQLFHSEHRINSVQTNQVNGHNGLIGNASQNEGYSTQPLHSHGINSVQTNHVNGDIGNSLQAELTGPQRVESADRGKTIMLAEQFQQNNNDNHQELPYPNPFIQSSEGIGYLHGGSRQINQQAPTWVSYKENNFYRPLAPSGQQGTQFQATTNSDPQRYNFMRPSPSTPLRPQQFNNPLQRLNQVPNMPNASGSLLQQSMSTQHSMPSQHMPRYFSSQHDQVSMAPRTYRPQTYSTRLLESSMPLRTPIRPPHQINPLGVSDLQYRNSLHSRAPMLSSGGNPLEDSDERRQYHRLDPFNPVTNQFGTRSSSSMLQEAPMHSGSYRLPAHQQASSQFSTMSGLPNSDHHYPKLTESNSFLPRLQQQQGLFNQTSRPVATYPGTSLSSIVLNSLLQKETGHTSAPSQMDTSLSGHRESENSGRRESLSWRGFESGESPSSPFKRMRRDSSLAQASSAQQENRNFLSLLNEASSRSNTGSHFGPRPIQNSVYDPKYEGIGLPIDPHLRLFATI